MKAFLSGIIAGVILSIVVVTNPFGGRTAENAGYALTRVEVDGSLDRVGRAAQVVYTQLYLSDDWQTDPVTLVEGENLGVAVGRYTGTPVELWSTGLLRTLCQFNVHLASRGCAARGNSFKIQLPADLVCSRAVQGGLRKMQVLGLSAALAPIMNQTLCLPNVELGTILSPRSPGVDHSGRELLLRLEQLGGCWRTDREGNGEAWACSAYLDLWNHDGLAQELAKGEAVEEDFIAPTNKLSLMIRMPLNAGQNEEPFQAHLMRSALFRELDDHGDLNIVITSEERADKMSALSPTSGAVSSSFQYANTGSEAEEKPDDASNDVKLDRLCKSLDGEAGPKYLNGEVFKKISWKTVEVSRVNQALVYDQGIGSDEFCSDGNINFEWLNKTTIRANGTGSSQGVRVQPGQKNGTVDAAGEGRKTCDLRSKKEEKPNNMHGLAVSSVMAGSLVGDGGDGCQIGALENVSVVFLGDRNEVDARTTTPFHQVATGILNPALEDHNLYGNYGQQKCTSVSTGTQAQVSRSCNQEKKKALGGMGAINISLAAGAARSPLAKNIKNLNTQWSRLNNLGLPVIIAAGNGGQMRDETCALGTDGKPAEDDLKNHKLVPSCFAALRDKRPGGNDKERYGVVTVTALDENGTGLLEKGGISGEVSTNYGLAFDVSAPGKVNTVKFADTKVIVISEEKGTSVAAPIVTSLAVLLKDKFLVERGKANSSENGMHPLNLNIEDERTSALNVSYRIRNRILATADFFKVSGKAGSKVYPSLYGRINAERALRVDSDLLVYKGSPKVVEVKLDRRVAGFWKRGHLCHNYDDDDECDTKMPYIVVRECIVPRNDDGIKSGCKGPEGDPAKLNIPLRDIRRLVKLEGDESKYRIVYVKGSDRCGFGKLYHAISADVKFKSGRDGESRWKVERDDNGEGIPGVNMQNVQDFTARWYSGGTEFVNGTGKCKE